MDISFGGTVASSTRALIKNSTCLASRRNILLSLLPLQSGPGERKKKMTKRLSAGTSIHLSIELILYI